MLQAHRAKLHDGRDVVVKVKFPAVEANFEIDMATITAFCKLVQPEQVPFLKEVRKQFMTEFDYRREADNLQTVATNLEPYYSDKVMTWWWLLVIAAACVRSSGEK